MNFIFAGLFSITLSFQLRKLHKASKKISDELRERYDQVIEDIRIEQEEQ